MASGWLNLWEARDPDRVRRQVDAERITVLSTSAVPNATQSGAAPQAKTTGSVASPSSDPARTGPGTVPAIAPSASSNPTPNSDGSGAPIAQLSCLELPAIESERAQAVEASMKQAGISVELKTAESNPSYIVYLAPSESAKEAQRKLAELKRLGVTDAFLMQDGPLKLGISLGLFRAEEGAKALVQQLSAKGIRSAKISIGNAVRSGKVTLKASGTESQLARARQVASEANLALRPCGT
jgi:hypothetical protein